MLPLSHACMRVSKAGARCWQGECPGASARPSWAPLMVFRAPLWPIQGVAAGRNNDVEIRSCQMITQCSGCRLFWLV